MGMFDVFGSKKKKESNSDGPNPDYIFAHYALRQISLERPLGFLGIVASPNSREFIESIMDEVAEQCGRRISFQSESVKVHPFRLKKFPCVIIEFPEPKDLAGAYMVAVVALVELKEDEEVDVEAAQGRYFTLEKGESLTGVPRTVLAEWTMDKHSNFGDGPSPNVRDFAISLEQFV